MNKIFTEAVVLTIKFYRIFISSSMGKTCRFYPSCSEYFSQSVKYFGIKKGTILGIKRIVKCHPFNPGGYDPVLDKKYAK